VRLSRALLSLFEGCGVEEGREWVVQRHRVTPAIPHSTRTASGMAGQWRVGRTASGSDSQAVSGDCRGRDSPLTRAPAVWQALKAPIGGAGEVPRVVGGFERRGESLGGGGGGGRNPRARRGISWCLETEVRSRGPGTVVRWATEAFWAVGFIRLWAGAGGDLQSRV
jgi:hypothetical protein